jgi:hypothetical protein
MRPRAVSRRLAAVLAALLAVSLGAATAAEMKGKAKGKGKWKGPRAAKVERLACKLGTEDNHARIAIELLNDRVREIAYYSIWKPRTCSLHVQEGDGLSSWDEFKSVTTVTLVDDKGAVLVEHAPGRYHFIFRDVDRMRYCGSDGKINGTLTVQRGRQECVLAGVMDDDPTKPAEPAPAAQPQQQDAAAPAPQLSPPGSAQQPAATSPAAAQPPPDAPLTARQPTAPTP